MTTGISRFASRKPAPAVDAASNTNKAQPPPPTTNNPMADATNKAGPLDWAGGSNGTDTTSKQNNSNGLFSSSNNAASGVDTSNKDPASTTETTTTPAPTGGGISMFAKRRPPAEKTAAAPANNNSSQATTMAPAMTPTQLPRPSQTSNTATTGGNIDTNTGTNGTVAPPTTTTLGSNGTGLLGDKQSTTPSVSWKAPTPVVQPPPFASHKTPGPSTTTNTNSRSSSVTLPPGAANHVPAVTPGTSLTTTAPGTAHSTDSGVGNKDLRAVTPYQPSNHGHDPSPSVQTTANSTMSTITTSSLATTNNNSHQEHNGTTLTLLDFDRSYNDEFLVNLQQQSDLYQEFRPGMLDLKVETVREHATVATSLTDTLQSTGAVIELHQNVAAGLLESLEHWDYHIPSSTGHAPENEQPESESA